MQVISKIEPTSPSSTSSIITPKSSNDLMQAITEALRRGQESANQLRILSNKRLGFKVEGHHHHHHHHHDSTTTITKEFGDDFQRFFDHHSWVTLNSFDTCISMIKSFDFDQQIVNKKRKVDDHDDDHSSKSEEISDAKDSKERRGCYKRRKTGQTWTVEATNLIDDGYGWRKYGQKEILHTKYPRNYYRCTHKHDQNCLATKQVQQTSANPTKYTIIYNGQHTCNNLQKTSSSIVIDDDSLDEKSSFFLSFATNNNHPTPKHSLNSSMFPSTTFQNNTSSTTMIKQDHTLLVKEESSPLVAPPPPPQQQQQQQQHDDDHHCGHDHHHVAHKQYPSSSSSSSENNHPSSSSDITSTGLSPSSSTPVSELSDVISPTVTYSSTPGSAFELMDEEIFLGIMNLKQDFFYPHLDALLNE